MNDDEDEIWKVAERPVAEFADAIKELELHVNRLVSFYLEHTIQEGRQTIAGDAGASNKEILSPLASAKIGIAIVFAMNACYWMYLVTYGKDPRESQLPKDLDRLKLFMNHAKELEESRSGNHPSAKRPKIDVEASKRLCKNNMSLASNWQ